MDGRSSQTVAVNEERGIMSESHVATHHELGFVRKYIFSTDHKVIGVQYMITAMFMAIIGGLLSMLMRYQLAWPQAISPIMAKLFPVSYKIGRASCREGVLLW